jgi:hypothetical protein
MTHEIAREKLVDLAYGELSRREARAVEAHAERCDACRAALAQMTDTRRLMSALRPEAAPERGESILLAAAREAARARARPRRVLPPWLWAGSVAAVALLAVGALSYRLLTLRPVGQEDPDALMGRPDTYVSREAAAHRRTRRRAHRRTRRRAHRRRARSVEPILASETFSASPRRGRRRAKSPPSPAKRGTPRLCRARRAPLRSGRADRAGRGRRPRRPHPRRPHPRMTRPGRRSAPPPRLRRRPRRSPRSR